MKKTTQDQEDKKPCKNCGGTGKLWSTERSYPCPDCCQPEAQTEQKVADHLFNQAIDQTRKTIHPQPTEQKECLDSDHLNHKDCPTKRQWAMEAIKSANEEQAKVMEHCLPQPTDGLKNWWEDFNKPEALNGFTGWPLWMKDYIDNLLAEQKQKTREDTIDEVLRALELNDDHEVPKIVIKALKSKKQ